MPFVISDLVGKLRRRLGNPLPFEISDTAIEDAIDSALTEYSKFRPRKQEIDLSLIEGQAFYDLPEGVISVVDCILSFRGETSSFIFPYQDFRDVLHNAYKDPFMLHPSRSMQFIDEMEREQSDNYDSYEWEYFSADNKLRIFPAPKEAGITLATVGVKHTEDTFPDKDLELMLKYAQAEAMETLGNFRSKVKELPTGVGYKMTLDGGATLLEQAPSKREEFYTEIKKGAGTWIVGG